MTMAIEVVEIDTDAVVKRIDCSGRSERNVERIENGLLRQMDTDRFYTRRVESGKED